MLFTIKSILISNILHLPFQSRRASTLFERINQSKSQELPGPFAALPFPPALPGYWLLGYTHLISTDDLCGGGGKGQTPWAPCQSALGKRASWARADIQFPFVYAIEGHTVWKRPATYPQIMDAEWETEVGSASISQRLPFPLLLLLSTWANDYIHVLRVSTEVTPAAYWQGHT